jgi:Do/DeqQ family serine protease
MVRRALFSLVLVIAAFAAGMVVTARTGMMRSPAERRTDGLALATPAAAPLPAPPGPASAQAAAPRAASAGFPDFSGIAGEAVKGVANISSLQVVSSPNSPLGSDPFFRYFFGDDQAFGSRDQRSLSLGSGILISSDGYIVTNNHVVGDNVREITVTLPDKREMRGKVIGTDPATDIALLKVPVTNVPVLAWGNSSRLKVGEWVLAIGSPFQLSQTVTAGIVSATGRTNVGLADYEDFIQTDAAINPGNSGGALINGRGELIGINTGIFSESGGYQGIGFAVPSDLARRVVSDLMKYGEVRRGSVGYLQVERLTQELARQVDAPGTTGAVVSRMTRNSEAYGAGLRPGDVIVAFNNQPIDDPSQFFRMVADAKVGSTATVKVLRSGRSMAFTLPIVSSAAASARGRR